MSVARSIVAAGLMAVPANAQSAGPLEAEALACANAGDWTCAYDKLMARMGERDSARTMSPQLRDVLMLNLTAAMLRGSEDWSEAETRDRAEQAMDQVADVWDGAAPEASLWNAYGISHVLRAQACATLEDAACVTQSLSAVSDRMGRDDWAQNPVNFLAYADGTRVSARLDDLLTAYGGQVQ